MVGMNITTVNRQRLASLLGISVLWVVLTSCGAGHVVWPRPSELQLPVAMQGSAAPFLYPCTSSCELTAWAKKANRMAEFGPMIGQKGGELIGQTLSDEHIPFAESMGQRLGQKLGRKLLLTALGGLKKVKESSEISFNQLEDLAIYLYVSCFGSESYRQALHAVNLLYPDFEPLYQQAIVHAPRREATP
jgi:hypothetical protein